MYRLLAVIIVVLTATSPTSGEGTLFYTSLRALGTECKRAVSVLDRVQTGTLQRADPDDSHALGACGGYLMGVKDGLPYDPGKPALLCIKRVTMSASHIMRAFTHYCSTMDKTGRGQKHLLKLEPLPGLFAVEALGTIYGCAHKNAPGFAAVNEIHTGALTPVEELPAEAPETVPAMVVDAPAAKDGTEIDFSDLIPKKPPTGK